MDQQGDTSEPEDGEILDENEDSPRESSPEGEYEHRRLGCDKRTRSGRRPSGRSSMDQRSHHMSRSLGHRRSQDGRRNGSNARHGRESSPGPAHGYQRSGDRSKLKKRSTSSSRRASASGHSRTGNNYSNSSRSIGPYGVIRQAPEDSNRDSFTIQVKHLPVNNGAPPVASFAFMNGSSAQNEVAIPPIAPAPIVETEPVSDDDSSVEVIPEEEIAALKKSPLIITLDTTDTSDDEEVEKKVKNELAEPCGDQAGDRVELVTKDANVINSQQIHERIVNEKIDGNQHTDGVAVNGEVQIHTAGVVASSTMVFEGGSSTNHGNADLPIDSNQDTDRNEEEEMYELELRNQLLADLVEKTSKQETACTSRSTTTNPQTLSISEASVNNTVGNQRSTGVPDENMDEEENALREVLLSQMKNKTERLFSVQKKNNSSENGALGPSRSSVLEVLPGPSSRLQNASPLSKPNSPNSALIRQPIEIVQSNAATPKTRAGTSSSSRSRRGRSNRQRTRHQSGGGQLFPLAQTSPPIGIETHHHRMVRLGVEPLRNPPHGRKVRNLPDNDLRNKLLRNRRNEQQQTSEPNTSLTSEFRTTLFPEFGVADTDMRKDAVVRILDGTSDMTIRRTVNFETNPFTSTTTATSSTAITYMAPINVEIPSDHVPLQISPRHGRLHSPYIPNHSPRCPTPFHQLSPNVNNERRVLLETPNSYLIQPRTPMLNSQQGLGISLQEENPFRSVDSIGYPNQSVAEPPTYSSSGHAFMPNTSINSVSLGLISSVSDQQRHSFQADVIAPLDVDHRVSQQIGVPLYYSGNPENPVLGPSTILRERSLIHTGGYSSIQQTTEMILQGPNTATPIVYGQEFPLPPISPMESQMMSTRLYVTPQNNSQSVHDNTLISDGQVYNEGQNLTQNVIITTSHQNIEIAETQVTTFNATPERETHVDDGRSAITPISSISSASAVSIAGSTCTMMLSSSSGQRPITSVAVNNSSPNEPRQQQKRREIEDQSGQTKRGSIPIAKQIPIIKKESKDDCIKASSPTGSTSPTNSTSQQTADTHHWEKKNTESSSSATDVTACYSLDLSSTSETSSDPMPICILSPDKHWYDKDTTSNSESSCASKTSAVSIHNFLPPLPRPGLSDSSADLTPEHSDESGIFVLESPPSSTEPYSSPPNGTRTSTSIQSTDTSTVSGILTSSESIDSSTVSGTLTSSESTNSSTVSGTTSNESTSSSNVSGTLTSSFSNSSNISEASIGNSRTASGTLVSGEPPSSTTVLLSVNTAELPVSTSEDFRPVSRVSSGLTSSPSSEFTATSTRASPRQAQLASAKGIQVVQVTSSSSASTNSALIPVASNVVAPSESNNDSSTTTNLSVRSSPHITESLRQSQAPSSTVQVHKKPLPSSSTSVVPPRSSPPERNLKVMNSPLLEICSITSLRESSCNDQKRFDKGDTSLVPDSTSNFAKDEPKADNKHREIQPCTGKADSSKSFVAPNQPSPRPCKRQASRKGSPVTNKRQPSNNAASISATGEVAFSSNTQTSSIKRPAPKDDSRILYKKAAAKDSTPVERPTGQAPPSDDLKLHPTIPDVASVSPLKENVQNAVQIQPTKPSLKENCQKLTSVLPLKELAKISRKTLQSKEQLKGASNEPPPKEQAKTPQSLPPPKTLPKTPLSKPTQKESAKIPPNKPAQKIPAKIPPTQSTKPLNQYSLKFPPLDKIRTPVSHSKVFVPIVVPVADGDTTEDEDDEDSKKKEHAKGIKSAHRSDIGSNGGNNLASNQEVPNSVHSDPASPAFQSFLDEFLKSIRKNVDKLESERTVTSKRLHADEGKIDNVTAEKKEQVKDPNSIGTTPVTTEDIDLTKTVHSKEAVTPMTPTGEITNCLSQKTVNQTCQNVVFADKKPSTMKLLKKVPARASGEIRSENSSRRNEEAKCLQSRKRQASQVAQVTGQAKRRMNYGSDISLILGTSVHVQEHGPLTTVVPLASSSKTNSAVSSTGNSSDTLAKSKAVIESLTQRVSETRSQIQLSTKEKELLQTRQHCYDEYRSILRDLQQHTRLTNFDTKLGHDIVDLEKKLEAMKKKRETVQLKAIDLNRTIREKSKAALTKKKSCLFLANEVKRLGDRLIGDKKYKVPDILVENINELVRSMKLMDTKQSQDLQRERGVIFKQLVIDEGAFSTAPLGLQGANTNSATLSQMLSAVTTASVSSSTTVSSAHDGQKRLRKIHSDMSKFITNSSGDTSAVDEGRRRISQQDVGDDTEVGKRNRETNKMESNPGAAANSNSTSEEKMPLYITKCSKFVEPEEGKQEEEVPEERLPLSEGDFLSAITPVVKKPSYFENPEDKVLLAMNNSGLPRLDPHTPICPDSLSHGLCTKEDCQLQHL